MEDQNTSGEIQEAAVPMENVDHQEIQQKEVPVHVVQSLRNENQQLKENFKILSEHLELIKANQPQRQAPQVQDQFGKLSDEDVVTVGELKKYAQQFQRQQEMSIEELKIAQMYPDYAETVRKYLPHVLKEDPDLKNEIENARNPFKMAYHLAKNSVAYSQEHKSKKKNEDAQRMLSNAEKTGSLSAVGATTPINQASRWKAMSDDEFRKVMNKNMGAF